ncbi:MAG: hypothetical protein ACOYNO_08660 [Saprospiraceae bacterium]
MNIFTDIRNLLTSARTPEALQQLSEWSKTQSPVWQQAVALLHATWANNEQQVLRGLIAYDEAERVRNRVHAGLLGLIHEMETGTSAPTAVLDGLQKTLLNQSSTTHIQGQNVTHMSGNTIQVQAGQDVIMGSGNTIHRKTIAGLGYLQFLGLGMGILLLLAGGIWAFNAMDTRQQATVASLKDIMSEIKTRSAQNPVFRESVENKQSELESWLSEGLSAMQKKAYPEAATQFERVVAEAPLATVYQNLDFAYTKMGAETKALESREAAQRILKNPTGNSFHADLSLSGTWASPEWGNMQLVQNGARITGTYDHDQGQIAGIIEKDRILFQWWERVEPGQPYGAAEKNQRGDGYFLISADNKKMQGKWRYDGDAEWDKAWNAAKK